jgi:hypothetical protein
MLQIFDFKDFANNIIATVFILIITWLARLLSKSGGADLEKPTTTSLTMKNTIQNFAMSKFGIMLIICVIFLFMTTFFGWLLWNIYELMLLEKIYGYHVFSMIMFCSFAYYTARQFTSIIQALIAKHQEELAILREKAEAHDIMVPMVMELIEKHQIIDEQDQKIAAIRAATAELEKDKRALEQRKKEP